MVIRIHPDLTLMHACDGGGCEESVHGYDVQEGVDKDACEVLGHPIQTYEWVDNVHHAVGYPDYKVFVSMAMRMMFCKV